MAYKSLGNAVAVGLTFAGSGGTAAVVGLSVYGLEMTYDHMIEPALTNLTNWTVRTNQAIMDYSTDRTTIRY